MAHCMAVKTTEVVRRTRVQQFQGGKKWDSCLFRNLANKNVGGSGFSVERIEFIFPNPRKRISSYSDRSSSSFPPSSSSSIWPRSLLGMNMKSNRRKGERKQRYSAKAERKISRGNLGGLGRHLTCSRWKCLFCRSTILNIGRPTH